MDVTNEEFKEEFKTELLDQCAYLDPDGEFIKDADDIPGYLKDEFHIYISNGIVNGISSFIENIGIEDINDSEVFDSVLKHENVDYDDFEPLTEEAIVKFLFKASENALDKTAKFLDIRSLMYALRINSEAFATEFYKTEFFDKAYDRSYRRVF